MPPQRAKQKLTDCWQLGFGATKAHGNSDGETVDREQTSEWTEAVADHVTEVGDRQPDMERGSDEATVAQRLSRATRYANNAKTEPDHEERRDPAFEEEREGAEAAPNGEGSPETGPEAPVVSEAAAAPDTEEVSRPERAPDGGASQSAAPAEAAPRQPAPVETVAPEPARAGSAADAPPGPENAGKPEVAEPSATAPEPAAPAVAPSDPPAAAPTAGREDPSPEPGPDGSEVLSVGRGIRLVAKLCECSELLIEGHLEATARTRQLVVAKGGHFIGSAEVDFVEIHGRYEGELTAAKKLFIGPTGSISGTTHYREIVIEAGGQIMGTTHHLPDPAEATGT
jgi:cytoskeletal protein CcmA (bactofilin family)